MSRAWLMVCRCLCRSCRMLTPSSCAQHCHASMSHGHVTVGAKRMTSIGAMRVPSYPGKRLTATSPTKSMQRTFFCWNLSVSTFGRIGLHVCCNTLTSWTYNKSMAAPNSHGSTKPDMQNSKGMHKARTSVPLAARYV